jgi:hypothetical protein
MKKVTTTLLAGLALAVPSAALAHTQTVTPPGQDAPVIQSDPISKPYAQAHCHAQSPAIVSEASGGVVAFSPAGALPCPPVPNPGGQVTGP